MGFVEPTEEAMIDFAGQDLSAPVVMLNLLKFHDTADYDEDTTEPDRTGAEAYGVYSETALKTIEAVGGRILFGGSAYPSVIGPAEEWDVVVLVLYPSRQAFLDMIARKDYQAAVHHRHAALLDSRLIPLPAPME